MAKNLAIVALSLVALGALGYAWQQRGQVRQIQQMVVAQADATIQQLQGELQQATDAREQAEATHAAEVEQLREQLEEQEAMPARERADYERMIGQLESELQSARRQTEQQAAATAREQAEREAEGEPGADGQRSAFNDLLKTVRDSPEMRQMVRAQQEGVMDLAYGTLFDLLDLPADQRKALHDLLVERQMAQVDMALGVMAGDLSAEEQQATSEQMRAATEALTQQIRDLLGEDNGTVFDAYDETLNERMQVGMFNQRLSADQQLDTMQQDELAWAMRHAREDYQAESNVEINLDSNDVDLSQLSPDAIQQQLSAMATLYERYLGAAQDVLTPAQIEQFQQSLDQQLAMQNAAVQMMFGGGQPAGQTAP